MKVRTFVTFRSGKFNISESKPHYINPCCFGDDVAEWLVQRLKEVGVPVDEKIGQEDFGWYLGFESATTKYHFVLSYNPDGYWFGWLERQRGFMASALGLRRKDISTDATVIIHSALTSSNHISNVRWHLERDAKTLIEHQGAATPLG
ncbi:MAG TPA: hypothetical protein VFA90_12775 [Terriglobales bacterium]|nr:hypothetical protein [Terriglobales bacterium]